MSSLAAITGEGVFNFGEVVATAAVRALANTPNAWLGQLLEAFNKGDIDAFNAITADNKVMRLVYTLSHTCSICISSV
jgi:26S proteasome regulatory subunit N9